jgi:Family of unknown function (DUF5662)
MILNSGNLLRHLAYLQYVLRHKLYVLKACRITGASLWRGFVHDWSKFLPSEWMPYSQCFYAPDGTKQYMETPAFTEAWNRHQKRNLHHWQAWLVTMDRGETKPLPMPDEYVCEMVADWVGASLAITGKMDVKAWYEKSKHKMVLHPETRAKVETLLKVVCEG